MPKTILIVEDNPDMRSGLQLALELENYDVHTVSDGAQALEFLGRSMPELILLDLKMPHVDGLALLAEIKENESWRDIPVIVLTAAVDSATKAKAKEQNIQAYLTKPFDLENLLNTIAQALHD